MRIAICDDTTTHRQSCATLLNKVSGIHNVNIEITEYEMGEQLLFALEDTEHHIDLIFLDISMPGKDGLEVAKRIRELRYPCEIVFFTVKDNCWSDAFSLKALHYIVKNQFDQKKFEEIFMMGVEEYKKRSEESLMFTCAGESRNIRISEISYFEVSNHIVTVHYRDDRFEFYTPLSKIEKLLVKKPFTRCHKSYLIANNHVESMKGNEIIMKNGHTVPVSRTYKDRVKQRLFEQDHETQV